jgi:hypothetical protein
LPASREGGGARSASIITRDVVRNAQRGVKFAAMEERFSSRRTTSNSTGLGLSSSGPAFVYRGDDSASTTISRALSIMGVRLLALVRLGLSSARVIVLFAGSHLSSEVTAFSSATSRQI